MVALLEKSGSGSQWQTADSTGQTWTHLRGGWPCESDEDTRFLRAPRSILTRWPPPARQLSLTDTQLWAHSWWASQNPRTTVHGSLPYLHSYHPCRSSASSPRLLPSSSWGFSNHHHLIDSGTRDFLSESGILAYLRRPIYSQCLGHSLILSK